MKIIRPVILTLLIILSTHSRAYVPPFVNVNSFDQAKTIHFSFGFGSSGPEQSIAFSLPKQSYIFFNSSFSIDTMQVNDIYSKHLFLDLGYGFEKEMGYYWRLITTGGYSYTQFGSRSIDYSFYSYTYYKYNNVSFEGHRIFVSANYGLKFKFLELYAGARITIGDYKSINLENNIELKGKATFEPNFTVKVGFPKIKFIGQIRHSIDIFSNSFIENDFPNNSFISFGVELNINFLNQNK